VTADKNFIFLLSLAFVAIGGYMIWRGAARSEFRRIGRLGWHREEPGSYAYWSAMTISVMFTTAAMFALCFHLWRSV
jgi:hypothetical protein